MTPGTIPPPAEGSVITLTSSRTIALNARGEMTTTDTRAAHDGVSGAESAGGPSTGSTSTTEEDDGEDLEYLGTSRASRPPRS